MNEITVHLRVNDAATGKPTPVRLCISNAANRNFAPLGRSVDFPLGRAEAVGGQVLIGKKRWFYIDGACEITLPTGVPLTIEIAKGILYRPVSKTFTLGLGQMALRFEIERGIDPKDHFFVDARTHFLTPHDALLEAKAEGVDTVELLIAEQMVPGQDGKLYPTAMNLAAFSGKQACLEREDTDVFVNTLNAHPVLGKLGLTNSHRPIFPLAFGEESDDWSLADWCAQCHRKKGFVVWVDALTEAVKGGEALVNAILGDVDAVELDGSTHDAARLKVIYHLWNLGISLRLVGGSGKNSNRTAIGAYRTGVHLSTDRCSDFAGGYSYATSGPVISGGIEEGHFAVHAESLEPYASLDVLHNGELLVRAAPELLGGSFVAELRIPEAPRLGGWLAAKVTGQRLNPATGQLPFAHGQRIDVGPIPSAEMRSRAAKALEPMVAAVREWVETQGRFTQPKFKNRLLELCDAALRKLEAAS